MKQGPIAVKTAEGFFPPFGFVRRVRTVLNWFEPEDLQGIGFVYLFDEVPPTSPDKNRELEAALKDGLLLFAAYKPRSKSWPAHIMLIVQNLCEPVPWLLRYSPALTVWLAENIAHEVGHHLIAERKFPLKPQAHGRGVETEEEFADRFAKALTAKLKCSLSYRLGKALLKIAAEIDYYKGAHHWKKGKYGVAANYFYLATQLRPDHIEASYWFWKAKEGTNVRGSA